MKRAILAMDINASSVLIGFTVLILQQTFLPWTFLFPNSDLVMSSWDFSYVMHAFARAYDGIWKKLFPRVAPRVLKLENKQDGTR